MAAREFRRPEWRTGVDAGFARHCGRPGEGGGRAGKRDDRRAGRNVIPMPNFGGHTGRPLDPAPGAEREPCVHRRRPGRCGGVDVRSGERLRNWHFPRWGYLLAHSPAGKLLAVATGHEQKTKAAVWLVDLSTGAARPGPIVRAPCFALALSHKGDRIAVSRSGGVEVHRLKGKAAPPVVLNEAGEGRSLAFDPSRRWLLSTRHRSDKNAGTFSPMICRNPSPKPCLWSAADWKTPGGLVGRRQARRRRERRPAPRRFRLAVQRQAETPLESRRKSPSDENRAQAAEGQSPCEGGRLDRPADGPGRRQGTGSGIPGAIAFLPGDAVLATWNQTGKIEMVHFDGKTRAPQAVGVRHSTASRAVWPDGGQRQRPLAGSDDE